MHAFVLRVVYINLTDVLRTIHGLFYFLIVELFKVNFLILIFTFFMVITFLNCRYSF